MHKAGKGLIRITVTGILFLLLFAGCAAADGWKLTAGCPSVCGEKVVAREGKDGLILSLPGFWDLSKITLEMEKTQVLLLDNGAAEVPYGEEGDLTGLTGRRILLQNENNKGRGYLTILQGSAIPALFLEVDGENLKKVNRSKTYQITDGMAVYYEADGTVSYSGALDQMKGRGNNTFRYSKKPYQIKLREKASLSGMEKARTWVLLANWADLSLLRNQIMLDMSREMGLRYAVNCVQADVWINGAYNGLYLLTEKIQIGKNRVNITDLEEETEKVNPAPFNPGELVKTKSSTIPLMRCYPDVQDPEDITGGYILTIEKRARLVNYESMAGFRTANDLSIRIKEPTYPSRGQTEYLFKRFTELKQALIEKDGINPDTGKAFDKYLDVRSFAQKYLLEEWCKNFDFFGGSQFLYKDSDRIDPLVYAGPSWDYDLCFGNMAARGYRPDGEYLTAYRRTYNIYWQLSGHEAFRAEVEALWKEAFRPAVAVLLGEKEKEPDGIVCSLAEYRERISASAQMNTRRWGVNSEANGAGSGGSFDNAVKYMENWIRKRTAWMDGEYGTEGE